MSREIIGIIGGTGLGEAFATGHTGRAVEVDTPFGPPSAPLMQMEIDGVAVYFLNRHGPGHRFAPSAVPYRANIFALKNAGVTTILASGAVGSLREQIEPGHLVLCDQIIDKTFRRAGTFFEGFRVPATADLRQGSGFRLESATLTPEPGWAVHVEFADPFCRRARKMLEELSAGVPTQVHAAGTYVCMEGPQFSTRAESHMHRTWGGDVIGMTCCPEAKLAREAEMCYALIALPTDYDCWPTTGQEGEPPGEPVRREPHPPPLLSEIMGNLNRATQHAVALVRSAIRPLAESSARAADCACRHALELAIWSDRTALATAVGDQLKPLLGKYLSDKQ